MIGCKFLAMNAIHVEQKHGGPGVGVAGNVELHLSPLLPESSNGCPWNFLPASLTSNQSAWPTKNVLHIC